MQYQNKWLILFIKLQYHTPFFGGTTKINPEIRIGNLLFLSTLSFVDQLGMGGAGHVWSTCEGSHEEEWRHSVAPIPKDKVMEAIKTMKDDLENDDSFLPPSGELKPNSNYSDDDDHEDSRDDSYYFEKEVRIFTFKLMS